MGISNISHTSRKTKNKVHKMKKIMVIPNPSKDKDFSVTKSVARLLSKNGAHVYLQKIHMDKGIPSCEFFDVDNCKLDLIIVIGGDGSFIDASVFAIDTDVPILGINLGKVGYLSEVEPSNLEILEKIFTGEYNIDEKILLGVKSSASGSVILSERLAVNDVVVSHQNHIGISDFVIYSTEGGVRYRADGVIFSTPAGSTAYSLSAGGPIVSHKAEAIIVTPIAPHSFFNRSLVVGMMEDIKLKNMGDLPLNISVDGREFCSVNPGEKCEIFVSDKKLKVLTFKENNMFSNLFVKMQIVEHII